MNILISSCLLAGALCLVAAEIGKIGATLRVRCEKRNTGPEKPTKKHPAKRAPVAADWDRIMSETKLEKIRGKK